MESYESKEHQDLVRSFLDGRFENTAFCLLAPDGKERLSGTGRSPTMGLRAGARGEVTARQMRIVLSSMNEILEKYPAKGAAEETVVQDFHRVRQAVNVASGDQRLLVLVAGERADSLSPVFADPAVTGRYHWDFADAEKDADWNETVRGAQSKAGIFIIQADAFGQDGKGLEQLPLDAKTEAITSALAKANAGFIESEKRKNYSDHVMEGCRKRISFENEMPYGKDRDGDGVIDESRDGRSGGPARRS